MEAAINTSGGYAFFPFHHLDLLIHCFHSPLLETFRCHYRDIFSFYDIEAGMNLGIQCCRTFVFTDLRNTASRQRVVRRFVHSLT